MNKIDEIVKHLMQQGKGILAADESNTTANKRLEGVGVEATEENRRAYRDLLLTTPGIERYVSGVILYDETIKQKALDETPFTELLSSKGMYPGIKVDEGLEDFLGGQATKGLESLRERLPQYVEMGARFTKWRAVSKVNGPDSRAVADENAKRLTEYASIVQEFGMVPMVEPEVLMEGTHSAEEAEAAIIETVAILCEHLKQGGVHLPGLIVKTSMAVSGSEASLRADAREVADRTVRALKTAVPDEVGGVVFLSGGQSPEEASANFNAIARLEPHPWEITFSFSRALQTPVLDEWRGQKDNVDEAQALFVKRLTLNVAADAGGYSPSMENPA